MLLIRNCLHTLRPIFMGLAGVLLIVFITGGLALAIQLHSSPSAFAASLQHAAVTTCVQVANAQNCNNQDPERQGCAADAHTLGQADIVANGITIGHVERRWSLKCQSWWGRVFDARPGSLGDMFIGIAGTTLSAAPTFVSSQYRILYSLMVYDATPTQQVPPITGTLTVNGATMSPSATLPAITIPTH